MTCPYSVTLNGLLMDGVTIDGDGIVWGWESIDGWWDSPDGALAELDRYPDGSTVTAGRHQARGLVLTGWAMLPDASDPLGALWYTATETLGDAANIVRAPGLLEVDEPTPKQAYCRRKGAVRVEKQGVDHWLRFQVPLLAMDPRKYAQAAVTETGLVLTLSGTSVDDWISVDGTEDTAPVITIDGPAIDPIVKSFTDNEWYVQWNGTVTGGDTLVLDMENRTAEFNGADAYDQIDPVSRFWRLQPGTNHLRYVRASGTGTSTAQVDYRPAWV